MGCAQSLQTAATQEPSAVSRQRQGSFLLRFLHLPPWPWGHRYPTGSTATGVLVLCSQHSLLPLASCFSNLGLANWESERVPQLLVWSRVSYPFPMLLPGTLMQMLNTALQ